MTLAETIYQKSLTLPPEKAREVLDFIDFASLPRSRDWASIQKTGDAKDCYHREHREHREKSPFLSMT